MGKTSVTGVGSGSSSPSSEHCVLGVNHLIGPRWDEKKEKEFNALKDKVDDLKWSLRILYALVCLSLGVASNLFYQLYMR